MKMTRMFPVLILQLFADGGDGGNGGAEMGVGQNPAGEGKGEPVVLYGKQAEEAHAPDEQADAAPQEPEISRADKWKALKGEYKDEYGKDVKAAVDQRFKSKQAALDRADKQNPLIERIAYRYNLDPNDIDGILKAWDADTAMVEEEAMRRGMSTDQYMAVRKAEMENASLRRQMEEREQQEGSQKIFAQWMQAAEQLKTVYPQFDLNTELENPKFTEILMSGVDMKSAYEVAHLGELVPQAMQFAAQSATEKVTKSFSANRSRPRENGMSSQAAVQVRSDPSKLTNADLDEIARRVARGERISF